jgi:hypothetical protein
MRTEARKCLFKDTDTQTHRHTDTDTDTDTDTNTNTDTDTHADTQPDTQAFNSHRAASVLV